MSEPFLNEISQEQEGTEELSRATQEFNEITNEPGSYIEDKIEVAQSEAIESSFNELVNTAQESDPGEMKDAPIPIPMPYEADEEELSTAKPAENLVETLPLPLPIDPPEGTIAAEPVENLAENLPVTVPKEWSEVDSSPPEGPGDSSAPAAEDDWESPNVHEAINPDPIYREADDASIDPGPLFNETGEVASSPSEGPGIGPAPASEDDWKPPLGNVAIDPRPIIHEADDIQEANESPMLKAQEPTSLLTDNEILAIQKQLETNTKDFMIVSVITESSGSAEKNAISNIR
jgi:hypothetical protein